MIDKFVLLIIGLFSKVKSAFSKNDSFIKLPYDYRYLTLPIQGFIIGLALFLWYFIALKVESQAILFSVIAFTIPIVLTRNIYIDNFLHTLYSIFSSPILAPSDIRLQKLSVAKTDYSRAGTICGIIYTFLYLFIFIEFYKSDLTPTILIVTPIISRFIGLLLVVTIKAYEQMDESRSLYIRLSKFRVSRLILISLTYIFSISIFLYIFYGLIAMIIINIFMIVIYFIFRVFNKRLFGGVTDDTLGFCVLSAEPIIFIVIMLSVIDY